MTDYYDDKLAAENLKKCYELAPPRTKQYLLAEIQYVQEQISSADIVLELGCGYGRVLSQIVPYCRSLVGIDTSLTSLRLAKSNLSNFLSVQLSQMTACDLRYADDTFDVVFCIQNGISAFKVDPRALVMEAYRVTKPSGLCLFSSYSKKFWNHRLEWFEDQAEAGLLGPIDWHKTKDGLIACKDGFESSTFGEREFLDITRSLGIKGRVFEVDESSLFCLIEVEKNDEYSIEPFHQEKA